MRGSRVVFWLSAAAASMILLVLGWGLNGCNPTVAPGIAGGGKKSIPCGKTKINVSANGVDKNAIYVCDGDKVAWKKASQDIGFVVHFDPLNCPFNPCPDITDENDKPVKMQPTDLTVYKYTITITVNGVANPPIDPHVVGGGGA